MSQPEYDAAKLSFLRTKYKENFTSINKNEIDKWRAVKCFRDHWDINAEDFSAMLNRSLHKSGKLLAGQNFFPKGMICYFAERDPEAVRAMFLALYDESTAITERIDEFMSSSAGLLQRYNEGTMKMHYQTANSVSVYLFFRYPDQYYIFRYTKFLQFANRIAYPHTPRKGSTDSVIAYYKMCDAVLRHVTNDEELLQLSRERLGSEDYVDENFHLLVDDFVFFGSHYTEESSNWWPSEEEYNPGVSTETWLELLGDPSVFTDTSLAIMKRLLDSGGEATCKQLSDKYGEVPNYYNIGSSSLAKRVWKAVDCDLLSEQSPLGKWWPILYVGRSAGSDTAGNYVWKLRPELKLALEQTNLSDVPLSSFTSDIAGGEGSGTEVPKYTKEDFLTEVYMDESQYDKLRFLLEHKKNVILQGAPGVGKTFAAKRLAYSMLGAKHEQRVKVIQFHQSYSYEDFMMGYRPDKDGFKLQPGVFYKFCQVARDNPEHQYFFIIDEINRGNMSKIFGELLMLVEKDYRDETMVLAYDDEAFSVPSNLYIIGMMNTADRSLAMIDYALRRRFSFFDMTPAFHNELFKSYAGQLGSETLGALIALVKDLNQTIVLDPSLGEGFRIGHSYFCGQTTCSDAWVEQIIEYDLIPMLKEYWFDDQAKVDTWVNRLRGILND